MRNRTIPLLILLAIVILIGWLSRRPTSPHPGPIDEPNESRIARDGSYRSERGEQQAERRDRSRSSEEDAPDNSPDNSADAERRGDNRARPSRSRPTTATPGTFDFYLLTLSWAPEFCTTHPSAAECATHAAFILHGLWPQNTDGTYPEHCSDTPPPADLSTFTDITPDLSLLQHEWSTHGTCSGLSGDAFFTLARRAFHSVAIPRDLMALTSETSRTPTQILGDFTAANPGLPASSLALSCGNNRLTAVEVCLDKTLHPIACQSLRSCRANSVRITPP